MADEKNQAAEKSEKKPFLSENAIEVLVAIFLGVTALLTAWASWIGSLHGGNQATNYTKSNNLAAEGNSVYNSGFQDNITDELVWSTYNEYCYELDIANAKGETETAEILEEKIDNYIAENGSENLQNAFDEMDKNPGKYQSPFDVPGMVDNYYADANDLLDESQKLLEEGQKDNANGDAYNLVNVIYSVVLFLLGIVGVFKRLPNRTAVLFIGVVGLVLTTVYMLTIPMPTGFSLSSFFNH
ncbi:hypothetical protein [Ruminococcus sp. NK3A76]|uniref:hypothetical protein n=1 Tax=Ruminococcus sp. NK3A76 TaxID=877411 RepID=UPI00056243C7|nr:hypothetical protein [Ruminococcus sp. NK3A76]